MGQADQPQQRQELRHTRRGSSPTARSGSPSIGTKRSPGTAIFALTGKVNNTGLVEVPMGITVGEIIFDIGGGIPNGKKFKAVQTGGPLGGCIPVQHLNVPVDFDSLKEIGAVMGSGGMIVVDEDTCMVEFSKFFLTFATAESCGKCIPCRVGGQPHAGSADPHHRRQRHAEGYRRPSRNIAAGMDNGSLCALGQLTPGPVMSSLRYFEDEFITHILDRKCPAGACKELVEARCMNACPAGVDVPTYIALTAQGRYAEGSGSAPRAQPVRRWSAAASARPSASSDAAAATSTSRSPSAPSSASWPTRK